MMRKLEAITSQCGWVEFDSSILDMIKVAFELNRHPSRNTQSTKTGRIKYWLG